MSGQKFQMALDWRTVKLIKDKYRIPLIIKGIATAEDAKIALDHGVEWIYVSNHGGRQLDHGRGTMQVLPEIAAAVAGRAKIMIDGAFCRGTDIVKGIAAGADLIGIGRLQCWALAAGGQAGIVRMLELLEDEITRCLGLLGAQQIGRSRRALPAPSNAHQPAGRLQRLSLAADQSLPVLRVASPGSTDRKDVSILKLLRQRDPPKVYCGAKGRFRGGPSTISLVGSIA